jgi:pimeloyl-ACP methyl ester carboxylesterase
MIALHYRSFGEPDAPPVVLVHGLFGSSGNWGGVARRLSADYRVLVPDLRNHGRSPQAPVHDYPSMGEDLIGLLDRLAIERAVVVGHSMGGKVGMHLALTRPGRVRALAVVDMAPVRYAHGFETALSGFAAVDLASIGSRRDADAQMRPAVPGSAVRAFLLQNLERDDAGRWRWRLNLAALEAAQAAITGFPEYPAAAAYRGPVLFIHGELSDYVRPSHHVAIERFFPHAALQRVDGAGHWVYADQPAAFLEALDRFIASLP